MTSSSSKRGSPSKSETRSTRVERRLAPLVHRGQVGLNQRDPAARLDSRDERASRTVRGRPEASGVARAGGDIGLDDDLSRKRRWHVPRFDEHGGHARHFKFGQVALVGVERHQARDVAQPLCTDGVTPGHELAGSRRVVPRRADHDTVECHPVDARVIPGPKARVKQPRGGVVVVPSIRQAEQVTKATLMKHGI